MNCQYCYKSRSMKLCTAGKPLYEIYSDACKEYYRVSVVEGKRVGDLEHWNAWHALLVAMRAYYAHQER